MRWDDFPLRGAALRYWLEVGALLIAIGSVLGWLILEPLDGSVGAFDRAAAQWFEARRTATLDSVSHVANYFAESIVKIPATIALSVWFLYRWRQWHEAVVLSGSLVLESTTFVLMSWIVGRDRPDVVQLDAIPPTGAFPSGHTAAAVAFWGALAYIVWRHTSHRLARYASSLLAVVIPIAVAWARMYRGMHHVTDVAFGVVVGAVALAATIHAVRSASD